MRIMEERLKPVGALCPQSPEAETLRGGNCGAYADHLLKLRPFFLFDYMVTAEGQ